MKNRLAYKIILYFCIIMFASVIYVFAASTFAFTNIEIASLHAAVLIFLYICLVACFTAVIDKVLFPANIGYSEIFKPEFTDIMSVFSRQADVFETASQIQSILTRITGADDIQLTYRYRGDFHQVIESDHLHIEDHHPLYQFCTEVIDVFGDKCVFKVSDIEEYSEESYDYFRSEGISYIIILTIEGTIFGWITLYSKSNTYELEEDIIDFLNDISSVIALGMRRVSLYRNVQSRVHELESLNHISYVMNSSLNAVETLESVMDAVMEIILPDRALLYIVEDKHTIRPLIGRGVGDDIKLDFTINPKKSVFRYVIKTKEPLVVTDVYKDDRVNKEYAQYVQTQSFAAVPLVSNEDVIGFIGVDYLYSDKPISTVNIELLMSLANTAAIAIANSRLYESAQEFNDELQKRVDEATDHLQKLIEMKSHFLKIASHQLRTPTAIIKGFLSMLIEDTTLSQDEKTTMIHQAFMSTTRLEQIISELLSATELNDSTICPTKERVDVQDLVLEIVHDLLPLAHKKDVALQYSFPDAAHPFISDRLKLKEILTSLVDNAIRYTPQGTVTISFSSTVHQCIISVKDTGFGISEEDKDILFMQFQRGSTIADIDPNGSGLGLFIVKRLIEILEGDILVESDGRNKGSEFIITIPHLS